MEDITIIINGQFQSFNRVWVHLQEPELSISCPFKIVVPTAYIYTVFDPHGIKEENITFEVYINDLVKDLGTYIVEGFIENIIKISEPNNKKSFEWVIAKIENIKQDDSGVSIDGEAVPFDPALYK